MTPNPAPEEREAVETALARLLAEPVDARSEWWRTGIRETVLAETDRDQAGWRPRSSAGATRA